jgi:hypothetical protein
MEENKTLKDLPYAPKRGKIYEMYGKQFSIAVMKENIDALLDDYAKITNKIIKGRMIPRDVWISFYQDFKAPENYRNNEDWLNEKTVFDNI